MKNPHKYWGFRVVIAEGFEPSTVCLEGRCSIQLSYATQVCGCKDTNVNGCKKYFFYFLPFLKHAPLCQEFS